MSSIDVSSFRPIFYPESLAVIGASNNAMKFGGMFMRTSLEHGYKGKIYPVNPKGGEIMGLKVYTSVDEIPDPVDFAIITVPAPLVLDAVKACIKKGIKGAEILTAGFRELNPAGEALENEIVRVARKAGFRLVGPNGFGIYSPAVGLTLVPGVDFSTEPGPVGFFSQSGGGTCDMAYMSRGRGVHFSVAVSYGNGCDIESAELLRYFEADPKTGIVGAYIEGVRDGMDFMDALKSCARKKPVVILKGGLTEQGRRGTMGHTGSMAGSKQAWDAAIKSAGAVLAHDIRDLVECVMAFNCLEDFKGGGAGILAGGGLRVVESLDAASEYGFTVPEPGEATLKLMESLLPPAGARAGNPVDLANPVMSPKVIIPIMRALADRDDIDFLFLYQMLFYLLNEVRKMQKTEGRQTMQFGYHQELARAAQKIRQKTGKHTAAVLPDIASDPEHFENELGRIQARHYYTSRGVPCFDTGLQAFSVLRRVADYYAFRTE